MIDISKLCLVICVQCNKKCYRYKCKTKNKKYLYCSQKCKHLHEKESMKAKNNVAVRLRSEIQKVTMAKENNPNYGNFWSKEQKQYMSNLKKQGFISGKYVAPFKGKKFTEKHKQNVGLATKRRWKDPLFAKKVMDSIHKSPNIPEQKILRICRLNGFDFDYVGSGDFIVNGKNPDFINLKLKKVILHHGDYFHYIKLLKDNPELSKKDVEAKDITFYNYNGFECLIIWESDLINENLVADKIRKFIYV